MEESWCDQVCVTGENDKKGEQEVERGEEACSEHAPRLSSCRVSSKY